MLRPNTVYDTTKPWTSNEERLTTQALAVATIPGEDISPVPNDAIARNVRPPLPRTELFPPKFGYRVDALGIADIVKLDTVFPGARVDFSGSVSGYQGTSTPALNVM